MPLVVLVVSAKKHMMVLTTCTYLPNLALMISCWTIDGKVHVRVHLS